MAIGRQDYQAGVVPIKSGYSLGQTPLFITDHATVLTTATAYLCSTLVAVGYLINITGIRVSVNFPGIQEVTFELNGVVKLFEYYDSVFIDNFPEGTHFLAVAGDTIRVMVRNYSGVSNVYYAVLMGVKQQIVV